MIGRIGIGHDIHRIAPGRRLVLGGVPIECEFGLAGHSDADVVLHAVCDALLGAAGLGDIGELFPDTDPRLKDADSRGLLADVVRRVAAAGYGVVNVDVIVQAERPRLGAMKGRIAASVAGLLGVDAGAVSVKAGTNEGLDAVGRGEAIGCFAAVLLSGLRSSAGPA